MAFLDFFMVFRRFSLVFRGQGQGVVRGSWFTTTRPDALDHRRAKTVLPVFAPKAWLNIRSPIESSTFVHRSSQGCDGIAHVCLVVEGSDSTLETLETLVEGLDSQIAGPVDGTNRFVKDDDANSKHDCH